MSEETRDDYSYLSLTEIIQTGNLNELSRKNRGHIMANYEKYFAQAISACQPEIIAFFSTLRHIDFFEGMFAYNCVKLAMATRHVPTIRAVFKMLRNAYAQFPEQIRDLHADSARQGRLDLVIYLHEVRGLHDVRGDDEQLLEVAICHGHVNIVQWYIFHKSLTIKKYHIMIAVFVYQLEMLDFLSECVFKKNPDTYVHYLQQLLNKLKFDDDWFWYDNKTYFLTQPQRSFLISTLSGLITSLQVLLQ